MGELLSTTTKLQCTNAFELAEDSIAGLFWHGQRGSHSAMPGHFLNSFFELAEDSKTYDCCICLGIVRDAIAHECGILFCSCFHPGFSVIHRIY
jgi:hypothetical protein